MAALLGLSAYQRSEGYGADLDDPAVIQVREAMGGQLSNMPTTRLRWYLQDLETAQCQADAGALMMAAQLCRAMRRDGTITGLLGTLTSGIVRLPKRFYGDPRSVSALQQRNGTRSVFDDMFPPSELSLMASDGYNVGVGVAELVPVEGRDFPIMIRLEPEYLSYRWNENRWYYMSTAGLLPITPGDGRWILHTPGGRMSPWLSGRWPALGRAFINKEHALLGRSNYSAKLANAARAAIAPLGSTERERVGMLKRLIAWGTNTVFDLPPGWDVKLIESNGIGYKVYQEEIDTSDKEAAIAIAGQIVTVEGGTGFSNQDVHRAIRADIIQDVADGLAYTLNTQGIPQYVAAKWGIDAIETGAILEWDVKRPRDLTAEAASLVGAANAITMLRDALAAYGRDLDIDELTTRFGVPIARDQDGDGVPDDVEDSRPKTLEAARARREARELLADALRRAA
jgi:hypothetical protein